MLTGPAGCDKQVFSSFDECRSIVCGAPFHPHTARVSSSTVRGRHEGSTRMKFIVRFSFAYDSRLE
jgi:hypothetical protein